MTAATVDRRAGNLPAELTSFVGRRHEVADVKRLLSASRLVTLTGVGGVGKTRLALRVAADLRRAFADGVWLVDLAALTDPALVTQTVAAGLGIRDQSARAVQATLQEHVGDKQLLLVLDNCEHLLDECAALADALLRAAPGLRFLATSRQSLGIPGERAMAVPPLTVPDPTQPLPPVEALAPYEAVLLFAERALAVAPGFTLTGDNAAAVTQICTMLDGVPLAIELAAVRLRVLSVEQILQRLVNRFQLLSVGSRTAMPRQRTLRALVDWSHELCTEPEQILWARASVFADGFDLDAAESVCAGEALPAAVVLEAVDGLADKSILSVTDGEDGRRYRMQETVRAYGLMRPAGERHPTQRRHRDHYRRVAARANDEWFGPDQLAWFARLRAEHANMRAAMEFCLTEPGEEGVGLALAADLWPLWIAGGYLSEGRRWLSRALTLAPESAPARATALWACAWAAALQEDISPAQALLAECRVLAERSGDTAALAYADQVAGLAALIQGDVAEALVVLERALSGHRAAANQAGRAYTLFLLASATSWSEDAKRTVDLCEEGLAISAAHGESWSRSWTLWVLAFELWREGEHDRACALARESLQLKRGFDDRLGIAMCVELLAWSAVADGRHAWGARLLGAARELRRSIGEPLPPIVIGYHEQCEADARRGLGERAFAAALRRGAELTLDEAIAYALEERTATTAPVSTGDTERARLTAREQQIAELVAQGMTNKEIAGTLVISLRTAEGHVEHILSKLGFTSRAQIAAWVAEHRPSASSSIDQQQND
jgi:predicted ATPase/DNA-binding CsgD family transcriptional regulator